MKLRILKFLSQGIFYCRIVFYLIKFALFLTNKGILAYDPYGRIYEIGSFKLKRVKKENLHKYRVSSINIHGRNEKPFFDLLQMIETSCKNKTSQAGERVTIKKNFFKSTVKLNDKGIYCGDIKLNYSLLNKQGKELFTYKLEINGYRHPSFGITEEYTEILVLLAFSGIYSTPGDYDKLFNIISQKRKNPDYLPYLCEECQERFKTYEELIEHLNTAGHYDSFIDQYPYYEPLIKIRKKYNHKLKEEIGDKNVS